ncbi:MAG: hypothetical protein DRJ40_07850 [Thermoprotei archaeon]|nr:MAG: hypothetical protein DRJ40_07850 [Thermoprotei archaeon]
MIDLSKAGKNNTVDIYICPICGKTFSKESSLAHHITRAHGTYKLIVDAGKFITRLEKVERTLARVERAVSQLLEQIKTLNGKLEEVSTSISELQKQLQEVPQITVMAPKVTLVTQEAKALKTELATSIKRLDLHSADTIEIPDYILDNPWLKVLQQKPREGNLNS